MAMMAITTSNSIKVKPQSLRVMVYALRKAKKKTESPRRGRLSEKKTQKDFRAPGSDTQTWRLSAQLRTELPGSAQAEMHDGKGANAPTQRLDIPPGATANNYLLAPG